MKAYIQHIRRFFSLLLLATSLLGGQSIMAQTIPGFTDYNIGTGSLIIDGTDTKNYRVFGTTTTDSLVVKRNYTGSIILDGVSMKNTYVSKYYSPITVYGGDYNCSNLSPVTDVKFILKDSSYVESTTTYFPAIRIDQGGQVRFSAIDTLDNRSGILHAKAYPGGGSAAIGVGYQSSSSYNLFKQGDAVELYNQSGASYTPSSHKWTAGGNTIISSGTIKAEGGSHGAGIGGGWWTWFVGNIIIYGGDITSSGGIHAAGIGTGCPEGSGNTGVYHVGGSIIALPPSRITATTAQSGKKGLAGAESITYIGDPESPLVTVRTEDNEKHADIYADITETLSVVNVFDSLDIKWNLGRIKFGNTADSAYYQFRGVLKQPSTFFTDKSSTHPDNYGRPYKPTITVIPDNPMAQEVVLKLFEIDIEMEVYPATSNPLTVGYSTADAREKAYRVKIIYNDPLVWESMTFDLQDGGADFKNLIFLNKDSIQISTPTQLKQGDILHIIVPLKDGQPRGLYEETLRLSGTWKGIPTGYLRLPVEQRVVLDDTQNNNYIKVKADPMSFSISEAEAATKTVTLNLNISHTDYNPNDVPYAKYLITKESNYDKAIAGTPINQWKDLNNSMINGKDSTTIASFAGLEAGRYYIHWFVISGTIFAHSKDAPTSPYGGFGPYVIANAVDDLVTMFEYGSVGINIFDNDPLPDFYLNSVGSALDLVTQYPKAGELTANGKQIVYKHTNASVLTSEVDSFAYRVSINGTNFDAKVYIYVIRTNNGNFAACKGTNYTLSLLPTSGVTFSWYDVDGKALSPATGTSRTITSIQTDTHWGIAPKRTVAPYKDLAFPIAPFTIKVVDTNGTATMRWTGAIDTCWHNPGNWVEVKGGVETPVSWLPTTCVNVIIPSDAPNYPMLVKDGACKDIEMQDRAMLAGIRYLTYTNAKVDIKLNPTEKDRFVMWSAPLKSMYSGDYHYKGGDNQPKWGDVYMNLFQHNNPDGGTAAAAKRFTATFGNLGKALTLGTAFNLRVTSTTENYGKTFTFPQTAPSYKDVNGITYTTTRTNGSKFIVDKTQTLLSDGTFNMTVANDIAGSNLIQIVNPYMAYLDVAKFLANNASLGSSYAIWNGNVGESFIQKLTTDPAGKGNRYEISTIPSGQWANKGLIPPLQSFFVSKVGTAKISTVKMSSDWTTTVDGTQPYALRSATEDNEQNILRIKATQGDKSSYAVLHHDKSASVAYDASEDMHKLFYDEIPLEVYSFASAKEALAINSMGDFSKTVNLGVRAKEEGEVTLNFQRFIGFAHDVYLIDNELKGKDKEIDLQKTFSYTFHVSKSSNSADFTEINDRFSLRFSYNPTGNETITESNLQVSQQDDQLLIQAVSGMITSLQIYNIEGALIYNSTATSNQFKVHLPKQQTYVVKAMIEGKEFVQKTVIK